MFLNICIYYYYMKIKGQCIYNNSIITFTLFLLCIDYHNCRYNMMLLFSNLCYGQTEHSLVYHC